MTVDRFIWQERDVELSQCLRCKQLIGNGKCHAFPNGIPEAILTGEHDHTEPYPGDNGIRFEPLAETKR